jgi:hypothetical protein
MNNEARQCFDILKRNPPPTIGSIELEKRLSDVVNHELGIALHLAVLMLMDETDKAVEYSEKLRIAYADFLEKSIFMVNEVQRLKREKNST